MHHRPVVLVPAAQCVGVVASAQRGRVVLTQVPGSAFADPTGIVLADEEADPLPISKKV